MPSRVVEIGTKPSEYTFLAPLGYTGGLNPKDWWVNRTNRMYVGNGNKDARVLTEKNGEFRLLGRMGLPVPRYRIFGQFPGIGAIDLLMEEAVLGDVSGTKHTQVASVFVVRQTLDIVPTTVTYSLRRLTATPGLTGTIKVGIYDLDVNNQPDNLLFESLPLQASSVGAEQSLATFTFESPTPLTRGEKYAAVIEWSAAATQTTNSLMLSGVAGPVVTGVGDPNQAGWASGLVDFPWSGADYREFFLQKTGWIIRPSDDSVRFIGDLVEADASTATMAVTDYDADTANNDVYFPNGPVWRYETTGPSWELLVSGGEPIVPLFYLDNDGTQPVPVLVGESVADAGGVAGELGAITSAWYRVSYGDENTAVVVSGNATEGGVVPGDARSSLNQFPTGGFGNLSDPFEIDITEGHTAIEFDDVIANSIDVVGTRDDFAYPFTHVYVWRLPDADELDPENGLYHYVGKMRYDRETDSWSVLYDTLSQDALVERAIHYNVWLVPPVFSTATACKSAMIGANGTPEAVSTEKYGLYITGSKGSKDIFLSDANGLGPRDPLSDLNASSVWPAWVEHGGGILRIKDQEEAYEIDYIIPNDPWVLTLTTPLQNDLAGATEFEIIPANSLYILSSNRQQQEQVRPLFILNGWDNFRGRIVCVQADMREDYFFVFTDNECYAVSGLPEAEFISDATLAFGGRIMRLSASHGAAGPQTACVGDQGTVYALSNSAVYAVTMDGFQDLTSDLMREYLQRLSPEDKAWAQLRYDGTRGLLYVLFGHRRGELRNLGDTSPNRHEQALVLDTRTVAFSVWTGGGWQCLDIGPGRGDGNTTASGGMKLVLQDWVGDIVVLDEERLCDKQFADNPAYFSEGTVAFIDTVGKVFTIDGVPNPYSRGSAIIISSAGPRQYSEARVTNVFAETGLIGYDDFTGDPPQVGDRVVIGGVFLQYQTGALRPEVGAYHVLRSARTELETETASEDLAFSLQSFSGGQSNQIGPATGTGVERTANISQLKNSRDIPFPVQSPTKRVIFGFRFVQPDEPEEEEASPYRLRVNTIEVQTIETGAERPDPRRSVQ